MFPIEIIHKHIDSFIHFYDIYIDIRKYTKKIELFKHKYLILKLIPFMRITNSSFYCAIYIMNDKYKTDTRNNIHYFFNYISIFCASLYLFLDRTSLQ